MTDLDLTAADVEVTADESIDTTTALVLRDPVEGDNGEHRRFLTLVQDSFQRQVEDGEFSEDDADIIIPEIQNAHRGVLEIIDGSTEGSPGYYLIPKDVSDINIAGSLALLYDDINT